METCRECRTKPVKYATKKLCDTCYRRLMRQNNVAQNNVAPAEEPEQQEPNPKFIPNWQHNGFPDKDKAIMYAMALVFKNVPDATFTWKDRAWTSEDISKDIKSTVIDII